MYVWAWCGDGVEMWCQYFKCDKLWRSVENSVEKDVFKCGKSVEDVCGSLHTNLHTNLHTGVEVGHLSLHTPHLKVQGPCRI